MSKLKHYDNYTKFDRVFKLNIRRNFQYLKKTTKVISIEINVEKISDYVKNFTSFLLFGRMHIWCENLNQNRKLGGETFLERVAVVRFQAGLLKQLFSPLL